MRTSAARHEPRGACFCGGDRRHSGMNRAWPPTQAARRRIPLLRALEEILPGHPVFHFARIGWSRMHPGEESL